MKSPLPKLLFAVALVALITSAAPASTPRAVLADAVADLRTTEGLALVRGEWRFRAVDIIGVDHRAPGSDLKPTGQPVRTHDISPKAGAADFDDSAWEILPGDSLEQRRTNGRLAFGWYRLKLTVPERIGALVMRGSTAVLELAVDDYAEVWVDGKLQTVLGSEGGALPAGWNAVQRVVLGRDLQPGRAFHIAIFAANGPLSDPPPNYVWLRSATIDFYRAERSPVAHEVKLEVTRFDPELDTVLPAGAKLEHLAGGFAFTEGPVWVPEGTGYLLFSDPNNNRIYRWSPLDGGVSVYRTKSGYSGADIGEYRQPGSNGLTLDAQGRLTISEHGNRRVSRLERNGTLTVLADRHQGKRLNSPNDLVYRSDGTLYFTDPFFGLPRFGEDPRRELPVTGVFMLRDGQVTLLTDEFSGPNGIAFSPDEKFLYVGNWDDHRKVVKRFPVLADGTLGAGDLFADLTAEPGEDAIDGIKVDAAGHVFVSGPGGVWVFAADGRRLGQLRGPEHPHNLAWGDADGRTLYLAAQTGIYRLRLALPGAGASVSR
jgi:gluconolactonase